MAVPTDVRVSEQITNMVNKNLEKFGRIDILVNNAGASFPLPTLQLSEGSWDAQWATALATPVVA
ncbi:MAG: SDR family oxidoreductase [Dehalococcoidia bacterium]|nr:SDR family oxidoreductase [Dehalococcoidia bacterium]